MDNLLCYSSSEDSSEEQNCLLRNKSSNSKYLSTRSQSKELSKDYFGLDNIDEEDVDNTENRTLVKRVSSEKMGSVLVPDTSFWTGASDEYVVPIVSDISINQHCNNAQKRTAPPGNPCGSTSDEYHPQLKKYKSKHSKTQDQNIDATNTQVTFSDTEIKRSLLSVHHLVSQRLSLHRSHKDCLTYPKRQTKEFGINIIVNKIIWSVPQYSHLLAVANADTTVKLYNCLDREIKHVKNTAKHSKSIRDVEWSHDGRSILSASFDKTALLSDVETGDALVRCPHENFVTACTFHKVDHNVFFTGTKDAVLCWDRRMPKSAIRRFLYKDKFGQVQDIACSLNCSEIFTCNDLVSRDSSDRNIMAWDFRKGVAISNQIYQERYTCVRLKVHPDGKEFYAQSQGNYIAVFSTVKPFKMNKCKRYEGHKVAGYSIGFDVSPNGNFIASGSSDGKAIIYDVTRARPIQKLNIGANNVCIDVAWHPVLSGTLATCSWDGVITLWQ